MSVVIEVVDKTLYRAQVASVDIGSLEVGDDECFSGQLAIYLKSGGLAPYFGYMEAHEFRKEFGFVLKKKGQKTNQRATENPVTE